MSYDKQLADRIRERLANLLINNNGMRTPKDFEYWINLALEFNTKAKSSKKKK